MTSERWDELVRELDKKAAADPRGYRRSVALWALAGYAALVGALVLAVAIVVGTGVAVISGATLLLLKLALPALLLALVIARGLSVTLPPPEGIELTPADAPALFEAIERLRERLGAPRLERVLLDGDYNASVVQIPRFGALGPTRSYLTVGLPYMKAMSPAEFESVLAHELGHISARHGRFGSWIYRLRVSWERVMDELDHGNHAGTGLFRRFFHWYVPRFAAHSFALVRAHEYEADRAAAEAAGARNAVFALARSAVSAETVGTYWGELYARATHEPTPPEHPHHALIERLPTNPSEAAAKTLGRALAEPTDTADTHPSLRERLTALGCDVAHLRGKALAPPETTAAEAMFAPGAAARVTARLDADWHQAVRERWAQAHADAQPHVRRLAELESEAAGGPLWTEHTVERAKLTEALHGPERALPLWREVLAVEPGNAHAHMAVGAHLLAEDDEAGLAHLERAAAADPAYGPEAAALAYRFEAARGREDEAGRHRRVLNAHRDELDAAVEERRGISRKDELEPHGLPPEAVMALHEQLARTERLAGAYLVRKRVKHLSDDAPLYVLGLVRETKWWRFEKDGDDERMIDRVLEAVDLPGGVVAVSLNDANKWLRKRLARVSGAQVFAR